MQAAFIDIGQERAAFLHVEDLIRPDDFEAYLTGGKRPEEDDNAAEEPAESEGRGADEGAIGVAAGALETTPASSKSVPGNQAETAVDEADEADEAGESTAANGNADETAFGAGDESSEDVDADDVESAEDDADDDEGDDAVASAEDDGERDPEDSENDDAEPDGDDAGESIGSPIAEGSSDSTRAEGAAAASAPIAGAEGFASGAAERVIAPRPSVERADRARPGGDPRRRDERGRQGGQRGDKENADGRTFRSKRSARLRNGQKKGGRGRDGKQGRGGGGRNGQRDASRLSRSTPIREVLREGQ